MMFGRVFDQAGAKPRTSPLQEGSAFYWLEPSDRLVIHLNVHFGSLTPLFSCFWGFNHLLPARFEVVLRGDVLKLARNE